jgi:hypothetical protein
MNHKELAIMENEAWEAISYDERRKYRGRVEDYWRDRDPTRIFGQVKIRRTVYLANSETLWDEILNHGLTLYAAAAIVSMARKKPCPVEDAIQEYKRGTFKKRLADGRVVYNRVNGKSAERPPEDPKDAWKRIQALIEKQARRALSGDSLSDREIDTRIEHFMIDMKAAVANLRKKVKEKGQFTATREGVIRSCDTLNIPVPDTGNLADLVIARKHAKGLRYQLHEDRVGKEAYDKEAYLDIERALELLEHYNEQIKETT